MANDTLSDEDVGLGLSDSEVGIQEQAFPQIKLSPYEQYRLEGREPVSGPFGPAHPEEVLTIPQSLLQPPGPVLGELGTPDFKTFTRTPGTGIVPAVSNALVRPAVETALSPAGILSGPLLAESAAARTGAGLIFSGLAAKSGLEKMQSVDPQVQLEGRAELVSAPFLPFLGGRRNKVTPATETAAPRAIPEPTLPVPETPEIVPEQVPPSVAPAGESPTAPAVSAAEAPVTAGAVPATVETTPIRTTTQEGAETPPKVIPMGMAMPEEFLPPTATPTSIKNATVDAERVKRGLPPAVEPFRRSFGEVWDRAMARIDQDPTYPDNLIDSLEKKPRALTDTEDATLLHRQIDLQNEYAKATRDLAQAYEDGRRESAASERVRVASLSDQLLRLYNIGKAVGTETGRGLNARKMLANEDFTLAKMTLDLRAAKGGVPLTPEESIGVQRAHDAVVETQKRVDEYEGTKAQQQTSKVIDELVKARPTREPRVVKPPAEEIKASTDSIRKKIAEGDLDISGFVRKLARAFVASGINDREALIDAVHGVLKEAIPEMTRREAMDAISGYGEFKKLTQDAISVKLRGMKGEMQQLAKLEDMAKGEPPLKTGIERRTPTDAERQLIKEVNDAKNKFQIPVQDPTTQLKSALDTLKTTLRNRIADYEGRLKRGDFAPRPRREVILDPEASRLKAENERVKKAFQRQVQIEKLKNRTQLERSADWVTKWRRGFLLSGPNTLAKLTSAALQRASFTPAEEAIGGIIGRAIPGVSRIAPREGGFNVKAEARAVSQGLTKGIEDAWKTLRTGQSDLDVLYGKEALLPPSAADFFGHIHGALKAPTKRAEFARSLEKRTESAVRKGVDVTDPMVQSRLILDSYKDANRSIFLQDNRVVNAYRRGIQALEQRDKLTGEVPLSGKVASTTAKILFPIVKVPTNIVAETMQYATGLITGSARLARAYGKGIENLKPEEADLIMRQLKKGSLGAAVMMLGYLNPDVVGGYYQAGEKRKPNEPKATTIRLYGHNIPSYLLHSPLMEAMQIGATVRRVSDAKINKHSPENKGIGEGVYAAAMGLAEDTPFLREPVEVAKAFDARQKTAFWGELSKSLIVPQALQWWANQQDKNERGDVRRRAPKTFFQHIQTGIPYLREQVPLAKRQP